MHTSRAPNLLMDDVHLLTARHFRFRELRQQLRGGKIFSSKFGARKVCIAPYNKFTAENFYAAKVASY